MKKRIFIGTFSACLAICMSSLFIVLIMLYNYYSGLYENEIRQNARYISIGVNTAGDKYLENNVFKTGDRITLIASDGSIKYDNKVNYEKMDNHKDREEFQEAIKTGEGESLRYSNTLSERTYYYALLLNNGDVLRVSGTQYTPLTLFLNMLQPILIIVILSLIFSSVAAGIVSRKIVKPINEIDVNNPDKNEGYEELNPLIDKLIAQKEQINLQMKELEEEHEQQDRMRREFTANVSHELKTPLTSISGFAEIIRDGLVKPQDIERFAGNIYDEAGRLITLVGDIIKISEFDEQNPQSITEKVDLYDIADSVAGSLKTVADKRGITINTQLEHCEMIGAEQILYEMIYNICDNAIKYNKDGGKVDITLQNLGDKAVLSVADSGIGIPAEDLDRVFERFYRVNKSHSKEIGGTGLGLSIVKHAALFHNAQIKIESELGVGTKIAVTFKTMRND